MNPIGADMLPGEPIEEGFRVNMGSRPIGEVCYFNGFLMFWVFIRLLPNLGMALLFRFPLIPWSTRYTFLFIR